MPQSFFSVFSGYIFMEKNCCTSSLQTAQFKAKAILPVYKFKVLVFCMSILILWNLDLYSTTSKYLDILILIFYHTTLTILDTSFF